MSSITRRLLLLLVIIVVVRLLTLGFYPLYDTTEARYAEISRKMLELNDWVTPWFDYGVPFWGKPPLSFWLSAISMKFFGVNEFAARLPHYLCGILLAWVVWDWAVRYSRRQAFYAVVLLGSSALFFVSAGAVMTDMTLALSCTLIMRGFWLGLNGTPQERNRERWLLFIGIGLGMLTKGPVALVLTGMPIFVWILFKSSLPKVWRGFPWIRGLLLSALIAAPWYIIAELHTPGFINYFLVGEHWHRFLTPSWKGDMYGHAHFFPHGTIWIFSFFALLPWSILLPIALIYWKRTSKLQPEPDDAKRSLQLYLLLGALMPGIFFTGASNIIWTYDLPGFPVLALWMAAVLERHSVRAQVEKLLFTGLLITLLGWAAYLTKLELRGMDELKVTKSLVMYYLDHHKPAQGLVFYKDRPYSAEFYMQGKAELVKDVASLQQRIARQPAYIVFHPEDEETLPAALKQQLEPVQHFGEFILFWSGAESAPAPLVAP